MHNLITERTPAAPWRRRNAGLVRASRLSFGWVPGARAVQLAKPNSGQKWRFWWLRPRANPKRRQNTKEARGRGQDRRWQSANASTGQIYSFYSSVFGGPSAALFTRFFVMYGARPSGVCCALLMCSHIYLVAGAFASGCGCGRTHRY